MKTKQVGENTQRGCFENTRKNTRVTGIRKMQNKCYGRLDLFIENVNTTTVGDKAEIDMTR